MALRVSKIIVGLVLLDEYDAPQEAQPIAFVGDAAGSATEKARAWLDELPAKIAEAEARDSGNGIERKGAS